MEVKRTIREVMKDKELYTQSISCESLYEAIECVRKLYTADKARYKAIVARNKHLFTDNSNSDTEYHFVIGTRVIECKILGLYEHAKEAFCLDVAD